MLKSNENISCAVLAGGKSRRMDGQNKAFIEVGCKTNLEKLILLSDRLFAETLVISNIKDLYKKYTNIKVYPDIIKDIGPLGGIHSAITNAKGDAVFFFPCDMPFINQELVKKEIEEFYKNDCDIIIPRINDLIEPLHSIYSVSVLQKLTSHLENLKNYSIRNFYKKVKVYYWDLEDNEENRMSFVNINTHKDLKRAENISIAIKNKKPNSDNL
ncbi:MAG: molybdenum cofactor guanylyltransferase [Candidatus Delongbacteria bacterium]|jgi:molybdopterin-guanine dinucleotide biosynthesis protein A|nr:molybdenum cofactor guanylyltransferase [Candidatus Delongbacteria bacterium]